MQSSSTDPSIKTSGTSQSGQSQTKGPASPEVLPPGIRWGDEVIQAALKLQEKLFEDEKIQKEFLEIFAAMNSENSNIRRGALKALIQFAVMNTKVSKTDVHQVAKDLNPVIPVLRSDPQKKQSGKTEAGQEKAKKPSNKFLKLREAELRGLFPDYKLSGKDSEYAKMKTLLVSIHKNGETVKGAIPRSFDELSALPRERVA